MTDKINELAKGLEGNDRELETVASKFITDAIF